MAGGNRDTDRRIVRFGQGVVVLLALLGMASVLVRALGWSHVGRDVVNVFDPAFVEAHGEALERRYELHPLLTWLHMLPGFLIFALGPLQFLPRLRERHVRLHRWSGRIFIVVAAITGVTALVMSFVLPVFGGWSARLAVVLYSGLFLFSLIRAFLHVRRREIPQHREWMVRVFALALGISTFRVLLSVSLIVGVPFRTAWGTMIWFAFALNLVVAEVWIRRSAAPVARLTQTRNPLRPWIRATGPNS